MAVTKIWKIEKRLDIVVDYVANEKKTNEANYYDLHKAVEYAKANPKTAKAVGLVAAATTAVMGAITLNQIQKQGEINGKYKEKMELQKALNE